jgi:hypothetical protein
MTAARRPLAGFGGALGLVALLAAGCGQTYTAERDGRDVGRAVCDVRDADSVEEAQAAMTDLLEQLDDLTDDAAVFTAEDRADIEENLSDLVQHVGDGDEQLAQQDIAVIQRSLGNIRDDLSQTGQAAVDGIKQGLDDCTGS